TPESFFVPDNDAVRARQRPAPQPRPYADAGQGRRIEAGQPLTIPRGAPLGNGRYESIDARQGALEFWFRPEWAADDISDRTIARCGKMHVYRRSRIGTYFSLGGTRQSGLVTEPGQWYHLAMTWDAGAPEREPEIRLFINGIDTGRMLSPPKVPLGDWTGEELRIGGPVTFTIDDLRISDVVRYEDDFDPPRGAVGDQHTLVHDTF
ncbi:MAG: LamG-like jellyroll fold domain-containing protein, partial [Armatimonadota bacterium]